MDWEYVIRKELRTQSNFYCETSKRILAVNYFLQDILSNLRYFTVFWNRFVLDNDLYCTNIINDISNILLNI